MNIKDYLKYYIGCRVLYPGMANPKILTGRWLQSLLEKEITVKPILRRLEDMTEEEMKEVFRIVFGRPFYEGGNIRLYESSTTTPSKRWVLRAEVDRVGIQWDGKIWADSDMVPVYVNPYFVTHYLLKCGFDIFGLCDAGLAIDAKTVNTI